MRREINGKKSQIIDFRFVLLEVIEYWPFYTFTKFSNFVNGNWEKKSKEIWRKSKKKQIKWGGECHVVERKTFGEWFLLNWTKKTLKRIFLSNKNSKLLGSKQNAYNCVHSLHFHRFGYQIDVYKVKEKQNNQKQILPAICCLN